MTKPNLSLILPCFNEGQHFEESINLILNALKQSRIPFEIIFVEDCSRDQTKQLIEQFLKQQKDPRISAIFHESNQGRGKSVTDGILKSRGQYVGFMDIDCEVSPSYIKSFVSELKNDQDVVIANRLYASTDNWLRALMSKWYLKLVQVILSTNLPDTEAGYKFFNRTKILPILKQTKDKGWFWDTEIMIRSQRAQLKIKTIDVRFNRRKDKTSTVRLIPDTIDYLNKLVQFKIELMQSPSIKKATDIDNYWQEKSPAFSNQYTTLFNIPFSPTGLFLQARHRVISQILQNMPGDVLLDVGCGSGIFIAKALELHKSPIGVDYSKQMLETARKNLKNYDSKKYKLLQGLAQKLPVKANSVDIILASGLTDYLTRQEVDDFFIEIKRVLKKSGHVIITFPRQESPLRFLRSGPGLWLRAKLLQLPPMETAYSKSEIITLFQSAHLKPSAWQHVFQTMWVVTGKRV